ncbi:MAG: DUF3137 domain-containing protein [Alphaproteobacteria bacterium]|nr:DUF3137 domain-containing protein [Alphaproteobacteria bacterium]
MQEDAYAPLFQNFENYCKATISPLLKNDENLRKTYLSRFWLFVLLAAFVIPVCIIGIYVANHLFEKNINEGLVLFVAAFFICLIYSPYKAFKKKVKNNVMPLFARFFEGFSYQREKPLPKKHILKSKIFTSLQNVAAEDCFSGTYSGFGVQICEQSLQDVQSGAKKTRQTTVFQGIIIALELNKNFSTQTLVLKSSGLFGRFQHLDGFSKIKLDNAAFNSVFNVYTLNENEARHILTPLFLEALLDLKQALKGKSLQASFFENKVFIFVETKLDMFEPYRFFSSNINISKINAVFEQFLAIFQTIDALKTNRKLGL